MSTPSVTPSKNFPVVVEAVWRPRRWLAETTREWLRRIASRRELAALTALEVKDLGYPAGLEAEKCKPFWES
jgi:uncharacterized protein YjiS (DUF1127 family)